MSTFEEGVKLLEEKIGGGKEKVMSLSTIARDPAGDGKPRPVVREVNVYYENFKFYVTTHAQSRKMKHIAENPNVAFSVNFEWFNGVGTGKNLGWVMKPENAELRDKLRKAFAEWYDDANNEKDENCCILEISILRGTLNINHWEKLYHMDFENKTLMENWGTF